MANLNWRSKEVTEGVARAPHRSLFYAMGYLPEDLEKPLVETENDSCPTCGNCSGLFTANSMNCLTEALSMALPGNGTIPAPYGSRNQLAKRAGMKIVELIKDNLALKNIMS